VPAASAADAELEPAQRDIQLVMHHHGLFGRDFPERGCALHGQAAAVHELQRLAQEHGLASQGGLAQSAPSLRRDAGDPARRRSSSTTMKPALCRLRA